MNLKESFRYQNFLDNLMRNTCALIPSPNYCFNTTQTHNKKKANPDADDVVEVTTEGRAFEADDLILFAQWLVEERIKLTKAINIAKSSIDFDIDAAIEANKFRQNFSKSIRQMLNRVPMTTTTQGRDYKFNVEGNQMSYLYEIEVVNEIAYDKDISKSVMRSMISDADKASTEVDITMINTNVDYEVQFDVNESFEDVVTAFIESQKNNE